MEQIQPAVSFQGKPSLKGLLPCSGLLLSTLLAVSPTEGEEGARWLRAAHLDRDCRTSLRARALWKAGCLQVVGRVWWRTTAPCPPHTVSRHSAITCAWREQHGVPLEAPHMADQGCSCGFTLFQCKANGGGWFLELFTT